VLGRDTKTEETEPGQQQAVPPPVSTTDARSQKESITMTRVVDETAWWSEPESSWLPSLNVYEAGPPPPVETPPVEQPSPPPYGYRYSEGIGYHPYVTSPPGTGIKVPRRAVIAVGVAIVVVVVALVIGSLAAIGSSGTAPASGQGGTTHHASAAPHGPAAIAGTAIPAATAGA
jgi:hypothetical protein